MDNIKNSEKELMERLDKCTALLKEYKRDNLIQAKEIDRLNEYIQVLELEQGKNDKTTIRSLSVYQKVYRR